MGTRSSGAKSVTLAANSLSPDYGSYLSVDGATAIKSFLTLVTPATPYGSAGYLANPFATASEGDEIFEANTGLILSTRVVGNSKIPVSLSGQTIWAYTASAPVQMGQQLEVAADGTVAPANAATDRLAGLAMYDAAALATVFVVTQGIWYGQVDVGALPARNVDCTSDASGRVIAAVSTNVANCIAVSGSTLTVLTRPMRLFQVNRPIILA